MKTSDLIKTQQPVNHSVKFLLALKFLKLSPFLIVSKVPKAFNDKKFIGQKVSIITNLTPKKIKEEISEGHILSTKNEKGEIIFVIPDNNEIKDGLPIS